VEHLGDELRELAARAVAVATDAGAAYADVRVVELTSEHVRVRNGDV
jgi:predicted Zn-dependent protease